MLCKNKTNASELNGYPLSDLVTSGYQNVASTSPSTRMTVFVDTERTISTIGYLECSSTRTMSSSPDGKGARKSTLNFLQDPVGISDICTGYMYIGRRNIDVLLAQLGS